MYTYITHQPISPPVDIPRDRIKVSHDRRDFIRAMALLHTYIWLFLMLNAIYKNLPLKGFQLNEPILNDLFGRLCGVPSCGL